MSGIEVGFGIIFLLISSGFGYAISCQFKFIDRLYAKIAFSIIVGLTSSTWLIFIASFALGSFSNSSILIVLVFLLAIQTILFWKSNSTKYIPEKVKIDYSVAVVLLIFIIFLSFNIGTILINDGNENLCIMEDAWADHAFHIHLITSFAYIEDFSPPYPVMVNTKLTYPFIMDFLSAIFLKLGLCLRNAIIIPNIFLSFALTGIICFFTEKITNDKVIPGFALILFFLNGNFGFFYLLQDAMKDPMLLFNPQLDYTHLEEKSIHFENMIEHFFISQRAFIFGLSIAVLIFLLLFRQLKLKEHNSKKELFLAGTLTGLLPFIYAHSFFVAGFAGFCTFLFKPGKKWIYFFIPLILFSLPQILLISQQARTDYIGLQLGWALENYNKNVFEIGYFWLANIGFPLILALFGFYFADKRLKQFYIPFIMLFIMANIIKFQPNPWDNNKILVHWFLLTVILAAFFLKKLVLRGKITKIIALILVFLSIFSGVSTLIWATETHQLYSREDIEVAEWIKSNTPSSALFLTSDFHHHPISLTGRQIVMGFRMWLATHALNYSGIEKDVYRIYATGDTDLIEKYSIDYVFISPLESSFKPNMAVFDESDRFELVYNKNKFKIYKIKMERNDKI